MFRIYDLQYYDDSRRALFTAIKVRSPFTVKAKTLTIEKIMNMEAV